MNTILMIKSLRKDGLSYNKISQATGIPATTLKRWVNETPNFFNQIDALERFFMKFYRNNEEGDL